MDNIYQTQQLTIRNTVFNILSSETKGIVDTKVQNFRDFLTEIIENQSLKLNDQDNLNDNIKLYSFQELTNMFLEKRKTYLDSVLSEVYFKIEEPFLTYYNIFFEDTYFDMKESYQMFFNTFLVATENKINQISWKFPYTDYTKIKPIENNSNSNTNNIAVNKFSKQTDTVDSDNTINIAQDLGNLELNLTEVLDNYVMSIDDSLNFLKTILMTYNKQIISILGTEFKGIINKHIKILIDKNTKYKLLLQEKTRIEDQLQATEGLYLEECKAKENFKFENDKLTRNYDYLKIEKLKYIENSKVTINHLRVKNSELEEQIKKLKEDLSKANETQMRLSVSQNQSVGSSNNISTNDTLKSLQALYVEFKECTEKLDTQKDFLFGNTLKSESIKENQKNITSWLDEIKHTVDSQVDAIKKSYSIEAQSFNDKMKQVEMEKINMDILIKDQKIEIDGLKRIVNDYFLQTKDLRRDIDSLNNTLEIQNESVSMLNSKIEEHQIDNENIMVELNSYKTKYRIMEDEIETLLILFEAGLVS